MGDANPNVSIAWCAVAALPILGEFCQEAVRYSVLRGAAPFRPLSNLSLSILL